MMIRILILAGVLGVASGRAVADPCVNVTADQAAKIANLLPTGTTWFYQYDPAKPQLKGPWKLEKFAITGSGSARRQVQLNGITMAVGTVYPYVAKTQAAYNLAWAVDCSAEGYPGAFDLAPAAPVDRSVPATHVDRSIPWIDRAEPTLRAMLNGASGPIVATKIQTITHSSGKRPSLKSYDVRRMGAKISVRLSINWQGGIISYGDGSGNVYTIDVVWEFSERGHISATIVFDNGVVRANTTERKEVDEWFRNEVYPLLYQNTGG